MVILIGVVGYAVKTFMAQWLLEKYKAKFNANFFEIQDDYIKEMDSIPDFYKISAYESIGALTCALQNGIINSTVLLCFF